MSQLIVEAARLVTIVEGQEHNVSVEAVRSVVEVNPSTTLATVDATVPVSSITPLSALRCVTGDGRYCDPDDITTVGLAGITLTAGTTVNARFAGRMIDAGWTWTPGLPIYCGANGVLTQTPPATGWLRRVAEAVSPTEIIVSIHQPILRD